MGNQWTPKVPYREEVHLTFLARVNSCGEPRNTSVMNSGIMWKKELPESTTLGNLNSRQHIATAKI